MAVQKIGTDDKVKRQVTCRECGSILEYLVIDIKSRTVLDYTGDSDTYYWIDCPECRNEVPVRRT